MPARKKSLAKPKRAAARKPRRVVADAVAPDLSLNVPTDEFLQRAEAELARRDRLEEIRNSLTEFCCYVNPEAVARGADDDGKPVLMREPYRADHLRLIAQALDRVVRGEVKRLFITTPPRHWKSSLVSEKFPAYYLGKHKDHSVIAVSHTEGMSLKFAGNVRSTIASPQYQELFPETKLANPNSGTQEWSLTGAYRMSYFAVGTGTALPGRGANLIIMDDPVADEKKAFSPAGREAAWTWYQNQLRDRLEPGGAIICVMSRWHYDDLPGRLIREGEKNGEKWEVLHLPAVRTDEDGGEYALWPQVWSLGELKRTKAAIGGRAWAAKYQGNPKPQEGNAIDVNKIVWCNAAQVPEMAKECRYWDLAFSDRVAADYAAGVRVGKDTRNHRYIRHVNRIHGRWPETKAAIKRQAKMDGKGVVVLIEANGTQMGYADDIRTDEEMAGYLVVAIKPEGNKEMRADIWASRIQDGVIHCVQDETWCTAYRDELEYFPNYEHDDQVDGTSGAMAYLGDITPFQYQPVEGARQVPSTLEGVRPMRRGGLLI